MFTQTELTCNRRQGSFNGGVVQGQLKGEHEAEGPGEAMWV